MNLKIKNMRVVLGLLILAGIADHQNSFSSEGSGSTRLSKEEFAKVLQNFSNVINAIKNDRLDRIQALIPEIIKPMQKIPERLLKSENFGGAITPYEIAVRLNRADIVDYFQETLAMFKLEAALKVDDVEAVMAVVPYPISLSHRSLRRRLTPYQMAENHKAGNSMRFLKSLEVKETGAVACPSSAGSKASRGEGSAVSSAAGSAAAMPPVVPAKYRSESLYASTAAAASVPAASAKKSEASRGDWTSKHDEIEAQIRSIPSRTSTAMANATNKLREYEQLEGFSKNAVNAKANKNLMDVANEVYINELTRGQDLNENPLWKRLIEKLER